MTEWEIDKADQPSRPAPRRMVTANDPAVKAALEAATARIHHANDQRHRATMLAVAAGGLCAQGLAGATRCEHWNPGAALGTAAALAGMAAAVWLWRRAWTLAEGLACTPIPLDDELIERVAAADEAKLAQQRARRQEELATIELHGVRVDEELRRLELVAWGCALGAVAGWLASLAGPSGSSLLAGAVAALAGGVAAWRIGRGGVAPELVHRLACFALPGVAALAALLAGTPWWWPPIGAALAGGAAWAQRARIAARCG